MSPIDYFVTAYLIVMSVLLLSIVLISIGLVLMTVSKRWSERLAKKFGVKDQEGGAA